MFENSGEIMALGAYRPLDDALRIAFTELIGGAPYAGAPRTRLHIDRHWAEGVAIASGLRTGWRVYSSGMFRAPELRAASAEARLPAPPARSRCSGRSGRRRSCVHDTRCGLRAGTCGEYSGDAHVERFFGIPSSG